MNLETTQRGFKIIDFQDRYGVACSMQKSSLATEDCIWLGCNEPNARVLKPGEGWVAVELPAECMTSTRMHLTQQQVGELLPHLQAFVRTGDLETKPPTKRQLWRRVARLAGELIVGSGLKTDYLLPEARMFNSDDPAENIRDLISRSRYLGDCARLTDKLEAALKAWEAAP